MPQLAELFLCPRLLRLRWLLLPFTSQSRTQLSSCTAATTPPSRSPLLIGGGDIKGDYRTIFASSASYLQISVLWSPFAMSPLPPVNAKKHVIHPASIDLNQELLAFSSIFHHKTCYFPQKPYLCISVFHGIRFKVSKRLVVGMTTFFFFIPPATLTVLVEDETHFQTIYFGSIAVFIYFCKIN